MKSTTTSGSGRTSASAKKPTGTARRAAATRERIQARAAEIEERLETVRGQLMGLVEGYRGGEATENRVNVGQRRARGEFDPQGLTLTEVSDLLIQRETRGFMVGHETAATEAASLRGKQMEHVRRQATGSALLFVVGELEPVVKLLASRHPVEREEGAKVLTVLAAEFAKAGERARA